ncbi:putative RNA-directed DNA polymerase from transposon X-element, partial [Stegodyphus mimosarum]
MYTFLLSMIEMITTVNNEFKLGKTQNENTSQDFSAIPGTSCTREDKRDRSPVHIHTDSRSNSDEELTLDKDIRSEDDTQIKKRGNQTVRTRLHKNVAKKIKLATQTQFAPASSVATQDVSAKEQTTSVQADAAAQENMDTNNSVNTDETNNDSAVNDTGNKKSRIPPITLKANKYKFSDLKKFMKQKQLGFYGQTIPGFIKIFPDNAESYRGIIRLLKELDVEHHSYQLPQDKKLKVVIRGLSDDNEIEEIRENLEGLEYQVEEIKQMTRRRQGEDIDVALLTETHATPSCTINISNFKSYRCDRLTHRGGGAAIFVKSNLQSCLINTDRSNGHDSVTVSALLPDYGLMYFTSMYQPPNKILKKDVLEKLLPNDKPTLLAGDLNAKHQEWKCRRTNRNGEVLLDFILNYPVYFYAPVEYTYLPNNPGRGDILDVVLSTTSIPLCLEVLQDLTSDHVPVIITLGTTQVIENKLMSKTDWHLFNYQLAESTYITDNLNTTQDIETAIHMMTEEIKTAYANATVKLPSQQHSGILPKELREKIKNRNRMRKRFNTTRDPQLKRQLNKLNREIKKDISLHKRNMWEDKIMQLNEPNSEFWAFARRLKLKRTVNKPIYHNDSIALTNADKAEILAQHLSEQFTPHEQPSDPQFIYDVRHFLQDWLNAPTVRNPIPSTNLLEVKEIIKQLRVKKAPGHDEVTNLTIKHLPENTLNRYIDILNACLEKLYFPSRWKIAKVILIPKPGKDSTRPDGFRPISLLPGLGKIYERIILRRLQPHMEKLPPEQFGFRSGLSTTKQLVRLTEYIGEALHTKHSVALLMLDVAKAFDRVWHEGLIYKLVQLDFNREIIRIIYSFIKDRNFYVSIGSDSSDYYIALDEDYNIRPYAAHLLRDLNFPT